MNPFLFFRLSDTRRFDPRQNELLDYRVEIWRPAVNRIVPKGVPGLPFAVFWLFHYFRVFRNREFTYCVMYDNLQLIHYCAAYPRFFRFPFMADDDMQVGSVWTHPDYRGAGLARFGVETIIRHIAKRNRKIWYVVDRDNRASVRLAERIGFQRLGSGDKSTVSGISPFAAYRINAFRSESTDTHNNAAA